MSVALQVADWLLVQLESTCVDLPSPGWAQLGAPTLTCASHAVGAVSEQLQPLFTDDPRAAWCGEAFVVTAVLVVARECAIEFDQDGTTNAQKAREASVRTSEDADCLERVCQAVQGRASTQPDSLEFLVEGGLSVVTATVQVSSVDLPASVLSEPASARPVQARAPADSPEPALINWR